LEKHWITPKMCANYLSLNIQTVTANIAKGQMPAVRGEAREGPLELTEKKFAEDSIQYLWNKVRKESGSD